ncbi:glutamate receptor U1-like isoform X2 [Stegodyphus dumicola]|uniref:glutamate receptor U1-like isoform X2 n=1 Tax=Stegodyphus dumicola TaxID=202533 RepID=UPI0015A7D3D6|nr:glutamate receptor U1-like isoform X2 [Stegodyphus dumicola]
MERHFKVAVGEYPPFLLLDRQNSSVSMSGPLAEAFNLLSRRLNFTYTLYRVPGDTWGIKRPDGWTGMLGMLWRKEVDLALGPFSLSYSRWSSFPMSMPMYVDNVQILVPSFQWELELFSMAKIFNLDIWISIFFSLIAMSLATTIADKLYDNSTSFKYAFFKNMWNASTFLLQKGRTLRPKGSYYAILGGIWMIGAAILAYIFSAMVLTNLFLREVRQIDSLNDLVAAKDIQPIVERDSSIFGVFKDGKAEIYQSLFKKVIQNPDSIMKYDDMSTVGMERVLKGSFALISDEMGLKSFLAKRYKDGLRCNYRLGSYVQLNPTGCNGVWKKNMLDIPNA